MTVERSSEIIQCLVGEAKADLFNFFVEYFKFDRMQQIDFAVLCGYATIPKY
jgi:hypothetical protein